MRLLLADDERELVEALCAILRHNNYSVDAVYNGSDALDYLKADNYDAAILDIMMPGLDGLTVLRRLREEGSRLPVLLLTAKSQVDDRVVGLDSGADDYLTKPFAAKELLARIRTMTRRQGEAGDSLLRLGNMTLNRATYELSASGKSLRLVGKEYQVLELLMSNPGQLISTERFLQRIWGYDAEADLSVVWVNLSGLRKRLASLGANVRIRSSRNAGYTLEVEET